MSKARRGSPAPVGSQDPVFGLTARIADGIGKGDVDTVYHDEVLRLVGLAAGGPASGSVMRLMAFGFADGNGAVTERGRAFLRDNAAAILAAVGRAVGP